MANKQINKYATLRRVHSSWMKDKAYKKSFEDLDFEFSVIRMIVDARLKKGMSQKELARKIGTKQSSIARFESGNYNPTLAFVQKLASALGTKIKVGA